jgi:hypothetical protein
MTSVATGLPWRGTAVSTTNIQIDGIHIDVSLENEPGSTACTGAGLQITLTGNLTGGHWTGNAANQHEVIFNTAAGLTSHNPLTGSRPAFVTSTFRDTQQTLTVTG